MQVFDNHAPINFGSSKIIAERSTDGGAYDGIGYNIHRIFESATMLHLIHLHSSGCEYNNRTDHTREYLFGCRTREEMIQWLLTQTYSSESAKDTGDGNYERFWETRMEPWANVLLEKLGYAGDPA